MTSSALFLKTGQSRLSGVSETLFVFMVIPEVNITDGMPASRKTL